MSTIRARDDPLTSDHARKAQDSIRNGLRVVEDVRSVLDDPRDEDFVVGKFDVLPDVPLVGVAGVRGLTV